MTRFSFIPLIVSVIKITHYLAKHEDLLKKSSHSSHGLECGKYLDKGEDCVIDRRRFTRKMQLIEFERSIFQIKRLEVRMLL